MFQQRKKQDKHSLINTYRHSLAHVMASVVQKMYPGVLFGFGPAIENGFYYDFDFGTHKLELKELKKIEKQMRKTLNKDFAFTCQQVTTEEALSIFDSQGQTYKVEQINKLTNNNCELSLYSCEGFTDLCEGPHVDSVKELKDVAFKLDRVSGAYWLGSEDNKMLTRIYALCFSSEEELKAYLEQRKKAEEWDHKKLGKELDLFHIDDRVGKGLILWTPNGTVLRDEVEKYARETEFRYGYKRVATPHIAKEDLFLTSGHLPAYAESMFPPMIVEEDGEIKEKLYMKPMNCPYHHTIFAARPRSYRELPLRLAEYGTCYRFEQSGELSGLLRVRGLTMNDAHIYCPEEKLEEEINSVMKMYQEIYDTFNLDNYFFRLSIKGNEKSDKFIGSEELWAKAEKILEKVLNDLGIDYEVGEGEAAFYGPKIDIQFANLMGREETVSTVQVDFLAAEKFNLKYINESGEEQMPVVIHRAPLSTHERFTSFLIEHYGGAFPSWMAPTQIALIPVAQAHYEYCKKLAEQFHSLMFRVVTDMSDNSFNKKIRTHVKQKIPVLLIIGDNEVENNQVTVRRFGVKEQQTLAFTDFLSAFQAEVKNREHIRE